MGLLEWLIVIFVLAWLLGGVALPSAGGLLNLLLVLAVLALLYKMITGRNIS